MKIIICLAFVLLSIVNTFSQESVTTRDEFLKILDKANESNRRINSPHRITLTSEIVLKSKNDNIDRRFSETKTVYETDGKYNGHYIYELSKNSLKEKYESIFIRNNIFERKDNEDWQQVTKKSKILVIFGLRFSSDYINAEKSSKTGIIPIEYKYFGKEEIQNQTTDVYATIENRVETDSSGSEIKTTLIYKVWITQDRKILKLDMKNTTESLGGTYCDHLTQTWEMDENIKIEAPVLPVAQ